MKRIVHVKKSLKKALLLFSTFLVLYISALTIPFTMYHSNSGYF